MLRSSSLRRLASGAQWYSCRHRSRYTACNFDLHCIAMHFLHFHYPYTGGTEHADVTSKCPNCWFFWIHSSLQRNSTQPFRTVRASPAVPRSRRHLQCRAGNVLLELLGSGVGAAAVTAVTTFTSEDRDAEIERLQVHHAHHARASGYTPGPQNFRDSSEAVDIACLVHTMCRPLAAAAVHAS